MLLTRSKSFPKDLQLLLAFDYDPASKGGVGAYGGGNHAATRARSGKYKLYFLTLWPLGVPMIQESVTTHPGREYPEMKYGRNHVNLG